MQTKEKETEQEMWKEEREEMQEQRAEKNDGRIGQDLLASGVAAPAYTAEHEERTHKLGTAADKDENTTRGDIAEAHPGSHGQNSAGRAHCSSSRGAGGKDQERHHVGLADAGAQRIPPTVWLGSCWGPPTRFDLTLAHPINLNSSLDNGFGGVLNFMVSQQLM